MAGAGAGAGAGPEGPDAPGDAAAAAPEARSGWAGLPEDLLMKVAGKLVAQNEAGWAADLKERIPAYWTGGVHQRRMVQRKREGNCLFVFALVCKGWRKAQLKVRGPLRTRVPSDVIAPGRVELAKWALAEGCPREKEKKLGNSISTYANMATLAAWYGHLELVQWLCREHGFATGGRMKLSAAQSGNRELVEWLSVNCVTCSNALTNV